MAFTSIDVDKIKVGDPITKELIDLIKDNMDDHETRINNTEQAAGSVFVLNGPFSLAGLDAADPTIFYYKCLRDLSITDFRIQIFAKNTVTSGTLAIDLQKSTTTNNATFNTILTGNVQFNFASDADYTEKTGTLNGSSADFNEGEVLRVKIISTPTDFGGKILVAIGAE